MMIDLFHYRSDKGLKVVNCELKLQNNPAIVDLMNIITQLFLRYCRSWNTSAAILENINDCNVELYNLQEDPEEQNNLVDLYLTYNFITRIFNTSNSGH